ncbi:large-conductance mechanosensitive channel protein MscL [Hoylesella timonensis]|uniref:large-conductance mechanosensitive channel protein MscL n=1 Tax=Hoylesella timonensis TaxID=386414 RepID=UPI00242FAC54|nr:large-conductance mechanosensitive channel protein MscL [Hoylesella timonensis]
MSKFFNEFKEFAMRGNVIDMAVGVIVGGAFGKIVTSLVNDIIMPPLGFALGRVDFTDLSIKLGEKLAEDGKTMEAVTLNYGNFIQEVVNFLIIAFCIFLATKGINSLSKKKEEVKEEPAAPAPTKEEMLLTEIRDLLKNK